MKAPYKLNVVRESAERPRDPGCIMANMNNGFRTIEQIERMIEVDLSGLQRC